MDNQELRALLQQLGTNTTINIPSGDRPARKFRMDCELVQMGCESVSFQDRINRAMVMAIDPPDGYEWWTNGDSYGVRDLLQKFPECVVGKPMGSEFYSSEQMTAQGIVGVYSKISQESTP